MKPFFIYLTDYLKGRSLYSPVTRALNFLLSACIASAIFEVGYFHYSLLDITDYKGIYQFFIHGHFAVPLIIFTIVHYGAGFVAYTLFTLLTYQISRKWTKQILKLRVSKRAYNAVVKAINSNPIAAPPVKMTKPLLMQYFALLQTAIPARAWQKARRIAEKKKKELIINFTLVFRGMVAVTIFLTTLPYLGWALYTFVILLSLGGLVFFIYVYVLLEISPLLIKRLNAEMTKWMEEFAREAQSVEQDNLNHPSSSAK